MKKFEFLLIYTLFFSFTAAISQDVREIVRKAEDMIKGETCEGSFTMKVVTQDYSRTVKMDSWWIGNEKALIVIKSPAKEAGNKTLKIGNEMWSYLKSTETTIKIPPSMLLQSWNGSDLTNDDLVRESKLIDDYYLKLMLEENIEAEPCWKIELTPKPDLPVVWGRIYYWIRKSDVLPAGMQFFDEKGKLCRTFAFSDYKSISGRKIPTRQVIQSNTKPGQYTEFIYDKVKFDIKISDRVFSFRELEK
jgi:outer membrane lipoprotein-sorting protein